MLLNLISKKVIYRLIDKNFLLFFTGALSSLSFAPTYCYFLLYFAFPFFFDFLSNAETNKRRMLGAFFFGFGHFLISFYWISGSLFIDINRYLFILPASLFLLPIIFSLFFILPQGWLFSFYANKADHKKILIFSAIWVIFEMFRAHLFYGFPWNLIGYSLIWNQYLLQIASYLGPYGMSLVVLISSLLPFFYIRKKISFLKLLKLEAALIMPFIIIGYFIINYSALEKSSSINVRIVQANILQQQRWKVQYQEQTFQKYINLSLKQANVRPDIIIWPESANDFILNDLKDMKFLGKILHEDQFLITGIDRLSRIDNKLVLNNSLIVINNHGNIIDYYDKIKLVPFGEFIPLKQYLPISKFTAGLIDYSPGQVLKIINIGNIKKFIPFICFEAIFPSNKSIFSKEYDFLVNITNDSWFGISSGPYQHFAMARVRAVESGVPLIRVAVTGISGLIDSFGNVIYNTELNKESVMDFAIPKKKHAKNMYIVYGDSSVLLIIGILLIYEILNCNIFLRKKS